MGEIAEMMLDGTMDPETGEFNFDGEDGPGWPMTGAQAADFRCGRPHPLRRSNGKRALIPAVDAKMPLGKKAAKWLEAAARQPERGYPGEYAERAPAVFDRLERMGFVRLFIPSNLSHKERYVITPAGRSKLAEQRAEFARGEGL